RHLCFAEPPPSATDDLPLHDALPIYELKGALHHACEHIFGKDCDGGPAQKRWLRAIASKPEAHHRHDDEGKKRRGVYPDRNIARSEEHTSELQSRENLVCRLLLEKTR